MSTATTETIGAVVHDAHAGEAGTSGAQQQPGLQPVAQYVFRLIQLNDGSLVVEHRKLEVDSEGKSRPSQATYMDVFGSLHVIANWIEREMWDIASTAKAKGGEESAGV